MALTEAFLQQSLIGTFVVFGLGFLFQLYTLYLNYKQAQVRDKSDEIIELLRQINNNLKK